MEFIAENFEKVPSIINFSQTWNLTSIILLWFSWQLIINSTAIYLDKLKNP